MAHFLGNDFSSRPLWHDYLPASVTSEALDGPVDVAIIGGGITGLVAAIELARAGARVVVCDSGPIGGAASTRNMSFALETNPEVDFSALDKVVNGHPKRLLHLEQKRALEHFEGFVAREKIAFDRAEGAIVLAHTAKAFALMRDQLETLNATMQTDHYMLPKEQLGEEIGGAAPQIYFGARVRPQGIRINPGQLVAGLITAALKHGVKLFPETKVEGFEQSASGIRLLWTEHRAIAAKEVIVATNGYTGPVTQKLQRRVLPFPASIIATEELPENLAKSLFPRLKGAADTQQMFRNFTLVAGGSRLIYAGAYLRPDFDPVRHAEMIRREMLEVFPDLEAIKIDRCWQGNLALTADMHPHLGIEDGVHYALGIGNWVLSFAIGTRLAQRVLGIAGDSLTFEDSKFPAWPFYRGNPRKHLFVLRKAIELADVLRVPALK